MAHYEELSLHPSIGNRSAISCVLQRDTRFSQFQDGPRLGKTREFCKPLTLMPSSLSLCVCVCVRVCVCLRHSLSPPHSLTSASPDEQNWLMSDMRVACPERGSFVYIFSVVAIFM